MLGRGRGVEVVGFVDGGGFGVGMMRLGVELLLSALKVGKGLGWCWAETGEGEVGCLVDGRGFVVGARRLRVEYFFSALGLGIRD